MRPGIFHAEKRAIQIDLSEENEIVSRELHYRFDNSFACVVHKKIESAIGFKSGVNYPLPVIFDCDVVAYKKRIAPSVFDELFGLQATGLFTACHNHFGAGHG